MTSVDLRRSILWVVFGMSVAFLWVRWQMYQRALMPPPAGPAPSPKVPSPAAPQAPGAVPSAGAQGPPAAAPPPAGATASAELVQIQTDLMRAEIDPVGATLVRVELPTQQIAPDWTEQGWARLLGLTSFLHSLGI